MIKRIIFTFLTIYFFLFSPNTYEVNADTKLHPVAVRVNPLPVYVDKSVKVISGRLEIDHVGNISVVSIVGKAVEFSYKSRNYWTIVGFLQFQEDSVIARCLEDPGSFAGSRGFSMNCHTK